MIDIEEVLSRLSTKRSVFHSEADFKHALAWEFQKMFPDYSIRLEFKPPHCNERCYFDIWITNKEVTIAIELKYKTRSLCTKVFGETFDLRNHSARDTGRYDFCRDVQRLEKIISKKPNMIGYAIFLTNDSGYWDRPKRNKTQDAQFRIHQGKKLKGIIRWSDDTSEGTMGSRKNKISINGVYILDWKDYSEINEYCNFKYLLVKVELDILRPLQKI